MSHRPSTAPIEAPSRRGTRRRVARAQVANYIHDVSRRHEAAVDRRRGARALNLRAPATPSAAEQR
jgi:hypothetical protein